MIKGSAPYLSLGIDPATNRLVGVSYDANGNPTSLGSYDVENRLVSSGQEEYAYGPYNERVWRRYFDGSAYQEELYFYGADGRKLATFPVGTQLGLVYKHSQVYFGGKLIRAQSKTVVVDRLGSVRANSAGERLDYYPYGEEKPGATAQGREDFGTYYRDNTGLDYAMNRYYHSGHGRFVTPDPYRASAGPGDPQSWNRYAYVHNDPVNFNDPTGEKRVCIGPKDDRTCWEEPDFPGRIGAGPGRSSPQRPVQEPSWEWDAFSDQCKEGLSQAMTGGDNRRNQDLRLRAVKRVRAVESTLRAAADKQGIDWRILAAIGIRESHGGALLIESNGNGRGFFHIDIAKHPNLTFDPIKDLPAAADFAADYIARASANLGQKYPNFDPAHLLQATAASWNFGEGNISGNPNTIDVGSDRNNYGISIVNVMDCFY